MKPVIKHVLATTVALVAGTAAVGAAVIWSGVYDVGADAPHTSAVHAILEKTVERSIAVRADDLKVPNLADSARTVQGAGNYDAMCVQCHLAPGKESSELSKGLYPSPPNLTKHRVDPAEAFWTIKHGIKASGMPAWGKSMKDEYIWDMAAFLQKLPDMNQQQYEKMVASSGGHSHGGGESGSASHHEEQEGHDQEAGGQHGSAEKTVSMTGENSAPAGGAAKKVDDHHENGHKH